MSASRYRNRVAGLLLFLLLIAPRASAQYIFLDANGDGVHSEADILPPGATTTADVRVRTNENRDGSAASCISDSSAALTINTYEMILRACGGTASRPIPMTAGLLCCRFNCHAG